MNVAIGATRLNRALNTGSGYDGIAVYTQALLTAFSERAVTPVIFSGTPNKAFSNKAHFLGDFASFSAKSHLLGPLYNPFDSQNSPDVFHATDHFVPKLRDIPVIANIHDPVSLMRPDWVSGRWSRPIKNWLLRHTLNFADHFIADSGAMLGDIANYVGIDENKISVVPLGVDLKYFNQIPCEIRIEFIKRLGLSTSFFLFIGTMQPRKNIARILAAHACLDLELRRSIPLVFVGKVGWKVEQELIDLKCAVNNGFAFWLHNIDDFGKQVLLQSALALIFPSLYEGFGLPILEAFASGLPVITSKVSAMPEVAGDAALLINPYDLDEIVDAMKLLAESPTLCFALNTKGRARAREFTWQKTAEQTMAVYREMM